MDIKKLVFVAAFSGLTSYANAEIKIGVVTSSSGPIAMVGIPQKIQLRYCLKPLLANQLPIIH